MKKIEMLFYPSEPSATNIGMKFVLFEVETDEGTIVKEWGFAYWLGDKWDEVPMPDGFKWVVKFWANTIDPAILFEEEKKIIRLRGIK